MSCHCCRENKLSNEFPHEHLTEKCTKHPLLHCLRCATKSVKHKNQCSQCDAQVTEDNTKYKKYVQTLEFLFPLIASGDEPTNVAVNVDEPANVAVNVHEPIVIGSVELMTVSEPVGANADSSKPDIVVTTLAGESITIDYDPDQKIFDLKSLVEEKFKIPLNKQCLLYNNVELKISDQEDRDFKLKDYDVKPKSQIYLVILLLAIPETFDHVIFDLFWGYPRRNRFFEWLKLDWFRTPDYLDASVFLYSGSEFIEVVYYCKKASTCSAVIHSGDVMNDKDKLGHHTINVSIKSLPPNVNRLVFALSPRNSRNVSKYLQPSQRLYDAKNPDNALCDDTMENVVGSETTIMCCLTNRGDKWQVISVKHQSPGNANNYGPLKDTIKELIESGRLL